MKSASFQKWEIFWMDPLQGCWQIWKPWNAAEDSKWQHLRKGPALLRGSRGQHWQSRASTCVGPGGSTGSQGPALLCESRGQHWQSRASTPVWVQGAALAVKGQHSCVGPGGSTGSQGPELLRGSRGQQWQSRASTPSWVQGAALAVRGQHSCVGPGGSTGSQGPALLCGSRGQHWQSRASIPSAQKNVFVLVYKEKKNITKRNHYMKIQQKLSYSDFFFFFFKPSDEAQFLFPFFCCFFWKLMYQLHNEDFMGQAFILALVILPQRSKTQHEMCADSKVNVRS